jgi:menaquinone-dependent protoporphyrinogen IX oxidase
MKTLITYGTKFGSTKKIAELITGKIENSVLVDSKDLKTLKSIEEYGRVIVGTNIIMGALNANVKRFLRKHRKSLLHKAVFGYVLGSNYACEQKYLDKLMKLMASRDVVFLGGVIDPSQAKGFYRNIINGVLISMKENNQPLPSINYPKLEAFIAKIIGYPNE